jgi:hypothetical protein
VLNLETDAEESGNILYFGCEIYLLQCSILLLLINNFIFNAPVSGKIASMFGGIMPIWLGKEGSL